LTVIFSGVVTVVLLPISRGIVGTASKHGHLGCLAPGTLTFEILSMPLLETTYQVALLAGLWLIQRMHYFTINIQPFEMAFRNHQLSSLQFFNVLCCSSVSSSFLIEK
jgi:hypothetical protein